MIKKLESLIKLLEQGDLPIEQSMKLYEEGMNIIKNAEDKILNIQGRVDKISEDGKLDSLK